MNPKISARAPAAPLLIGLVAGLILAQHYRAPLSHILPVALGSGLIVLLLSLKNTFKWFWALVFIVGATLCSWAYGSIRLIPKPSASDLAMPQREAQLVLKVQKIMHINHHYKSASVIARILRAPEIGRLREGELIYAQLKLPEAFLLAKNMSVLLQKGLEVRATGLLKPIPDPAKAKEINDFNHYLKNIGVHYRLDRTHKLKPVKLPSAFAQFCATTNQRFQEILRLGTPDSSELANIYVTMLLGKSSALTKKQRERYRKTGTMHFFAISGLHIGVIATVIAQFLLLIRVPHNWGPWIGLPLLYLYVEITGASPSAMRAFLMTAFFWSSFAFRRQHASFAALVNSAIIVLLMDPSQLWSLGFQLSYTVVAGILMFGLPLNLYLKQSFQLYQWLPEKDWTTHQRIISWSLDKLIPLFAISLSAWLTSLPLCAAFFNFIAPGAIVLSMLLVCLVTVTIVSGVLSITCAALPLPAVSEFINHAAWLVLFCMDWIVRLGTAIPNITFSGSAFLTELCYAALAAYFLSLFWLNSRTKRTKANRLWLPVIILLTGMSLIRLVVLN